MTSNTIIHCRTDASPNQNVLSGKVIATCCMNKLLQGYGNCEVPLHCCNTMILYCYNTRCLRYIIIALSYCEEAAYNYTATLFAFLCYCNSSTYQPLQLRIPCTCSELDNCYQQLLCCRGVSPCSVHWRIHAHRTKDGQVQSYSKREQNMLASPSRYLI